MAQVLTRPTSVYRGTWDEVLSHRHEISPDALLELRVFEQPVEVEQKLPAKRRQPSAGGKYAFVPGGSEEFAREKQREIDMEDRPRG